MSDIQKAAERLTQSEWIKRTVAPGVYAVVCMASGNWYVGISHQIQIRWAQHYQACKKQHYKKDEDADFGKKIWQDDYNENGKHSFAHFILCERYNEELYKSLEAHLIKRFNPVYNKVHRASEGKQTPFNYAIVQKEVQMFLKLWPVTLLRKLPINKPVSFAACYNRMKDDNKLGITGLTKAQLKANIQDLFAHEFKFEKHTITKIKEHETNEKK